MTKFTPEQIAYLESVITFRDGELAIQDVRGNVWGDVLGTVWGTVWGDVRGAVRGDVLGTIHVRQPTTDIETRADEEAEERACRQRRWTGAWNE